MQKYDSSTWLTNRGFYALLILALLIVGLGLSALRRRRAKPPPGPAGWYVSARRRRRH